VKGKDRLEVKWEDGHESSYSLSKLEELELKELPISQSPYLTKDTSIPEVG